MNKRGRHEVWLLSKVTNQNDVNMLVVSSRKQADNWILNNEFDYVDNFENTI
jgi:hypothetical protein